jgi:drug/metabolite transporter (DMT)-like permease
MLISGFVIFSPQISPMQFSLASMLCWGTSDFIGGYASRRANAVLVTAITNAAGLVAIALAVWLSGVPMPPAKNMVWALAGGALGGSALALFYRALASGNMGLTAPVAAVLSAAIPALYGMISDGIPHKIQLAGFVFAAVGIWLISRSDQSGAPAGIGLAMISGIGFAGFYICARQAGLGSPVWFAAASRCGAFVCTTIWLFLTGSFAPKNPASLRWAVFTGLADVSGSVLFFSSLQRGRMDVSVVLSSLYPVITVLLARIFLQERFNGWKVAGMAAAVLAVPLIAA